VSRAAAKVHDLGSLLPRIEDARRDGQRIALANGLFDILHVGHLRYLEAAAATADRLVVAVNSDRSARELREPGRPVVPERERAELVAGFGCVWLVTIFDSRTVEPLLRACRPDVHCKGTDYTPDTVPEVEVARELGIRVLIVGDEKRHSSRDIIRRMRDGS
jgi:rfaE bifunctional protein nucleotidyltransferase chain/domain